MDKISAIYVRVSHKSQETRSQTSELDRWKQSQDGEFKTYTDKASGRKMDRPGWNDLWADVLAGKIGRIVVWRLDRLGRTAAGLTKLFDDLIERKINLVSLKDSLDLSTAAGRLMANVLASVAAYEREIRQERQTAGIQAAKAAGKSWGGRSAGTLNKTTADKKSAVIALHKAEKSISEISRVTGLSRPTVYALLS